MLDLTINYKGRLIYCALNDVNQSYFDYYDLDSEERLGSEGAVITDHEALIDLDLMTQGLLIQEMTVRAEYLNVINEQDEYYDSFGCYIIT